MLKAANPELIIIRIVLWPLKWRIAATQYVRSFFSLVTFQSVIHKQPDVLKAYMF